MSDFKDDKWVVENSQIAAEKLHALGVVAFRWNSAEISLRSTLILLLRLNWNVAWSVIHEMGDMALMVSIREIIESNPVPKEVAETIEHGLKLYDANRLNRNQLTHFLPAALVGSDLTRMKGPRFDPQPFPDSVGDLRRVADDLADLLEYFGKLLTIMHSRQYSQKPGGLLPPLPDKVPLPERLWKPPPPNPQGRKERPGKDQG